MIGERAAGRREKERRRQNSGSEGWQESERWEGRKEEGSEGGRVRRRGREGGKRNTPPRRCAHD